MSDEAVSAPAVSPHRTWYPGMPSPNPGGRSKQVAHLQDLAREHTPAAIAKILALMNDEKASRLTQLACAREILDRAYGKPAQTTEITGLVPTDDEQLQAEMGRPQFMLHVAQRLAYILHVGAAAGVELGVLPAQSSIDAGETR